MKININEITIKPHITRPYTTIQPKNNNYTVKLTIQRPVDIHTRYYRYILGTFF